MREAGDDTLSLVDADSLEVVVEPAVDVAIEVSPNRQFVTLVPDGQWVADDDGAVTVQLSGDYLRNPEREGLATTGGTAAGTFAESFTFELVADGEGPELVVPAPGTGGPTWVMRRLAVPLPTLMPSYNQIGFDSLYFLVSLVEFDGEQGVAQVMEAALEGTNEDGSVRVRPVPGTRGVFAARIDVDGPLFTLNSDDGAALEVLTATIAFRSFRISGLLDSEASGIGPMQAHATAVCETLSVYGPFLRRLGLCNPESDVLTAWGAVLLEPHPAPADVVLDTLGTVDANATDERLELTFDGATLSRADRNVSVLVVDTATGRPVPLAYGTDQRFGTTDAGAIEWLRLPWADVELPASVRVWLMIDTIPAMSFELDLR